MHTKRFGGLGLAFALIATLFGLAGSSAGAENNSVSHSRYYEVTVKIQNLAPADGTLQTPFWVALHNGKFDIYDRGAPASPALERLAEDGITGPISEAFAGSRGQDATLAGPGGPLASGEVSTQSFLVKGSAPSSRYFSYASMVIPSNDAFVSNGDPKAHQLFDRNGRFIAQDFIIAGSAALDAGTERNDEIPAHTAALEQAAPNTGVAEGGTVQMHGGFLPGGNILTARPAGDFTTAGYQLAKVSFSAKPVSPRAYAGLSGSQEVPAVVTNGFGKAHLRITSTGDIHFDVRTRRTANVTAAHIHSGAAGANGPVIATLYSGNAIDDLRIGGVLERSDLAMTPAALWAMVESGAAYVNVHTVANPGGELRGQL